MDQSKCRKRALAFLGLADVTLTAFKLLAVALCAITVIDAFTNINIGNFNGFCRALSGAVIANMTLAGVFAWISANNFAKYAVLMEREHAEREVTWKSEYKEAQERVRQELFGKDWEKIRDEILQKYGQAAKSPRAWSNQINTPTSVRHHYTVLDLPDGSDASSTRTRYHQLMRKCHPDLVPGKEAQEQAQKLTSAYKEIQAFLQREADRQR